MAVAKRVVIADRNPFLRALLTRLCMNAGHVVLGEAADSDGLLELVRSARPDVVITDVDLEDGPIEPILPLIQGTGHEVVVLCAQAAPDRLSAILGEGVSGYLLHDTAPLQVIEALQIVTGGAAALHPAVAGTVLRQWRAFRSGGQAAAGARLTPRELEVLTGMVEGLPTKGIARRLGVALKTVENHKLRIFDKLGARTQAHAVGVALAHGLVPVVTPAE